MSSGEEKKILGERWHEDKMDVAEELPMIYSHFRDSYIITNIIGDAFENIITSSISLYREIYGPPSEIRRKSRQKCKEQMNESSLSCSLYLSISPSGLCSSKLATPKKCYEINLNPKNVWGLTGSVEGKVEASPLFSLEKKIRRGGKYCRRLSVDRAGEFRIPRRGGSYWKSGPPLRRIYA